MIIALEIVALHNAHNCGSLLLGYVSKFHPSLKQLLKD